MFSFLKARRDRAQSNAVCTGAIIQGYKSNELEAFVRAVGRRAGSGTIVLEHENVKIAISTQIPENQIGSKKISRVSVWQNGTPILDFSAWKGFRLRPTMDAIVKCLQLGDVRILQDYLQSKSKEVVPNYATWDLPVADAEFSGPYQRTRLPSPVQFIAGLVSKPFMPMSKFLFSLEELKHLDTTPPETKIIPVCSIVGTVGGGSLTKAKSERPWDLSYQDRGLERSYEIARDLVERASLLALERPIRVTQFMGASFLAEDSFHLGTALLGLDSGSLKAKALVREIKLPVTVETDDRDYCATIFRRADQGLLRAEIDFSRSPPRGPFVRQRLHQGSLNLTRITISESAEAWCLAMDAGKARDICVRAGLETGRRFAARAGATGQ